MDNSTVQALVDLNRRFYERFALDFARSRSPEQAGLRRLLAFLPAQGHLLDVGCGQGRLAALLARHGSALRYTGVDNSAALLALAREQALALQTRWIEADLLSESWPDQVPAAQFEAIASLAVLHHLPGRRNRLGLLRAMQRLLAPDGVLLLSTWQFLNEDRLRRKQMPWSAAGIAPEQVEPGDYLLDWQRGGSGLRYCHLVDEAELRQLAAEAGLEPQAVYYDDGRSRTLNLFAVLCRAG